MEKFIEKINQLIFSWIFIYRIHLVSWQSCEFLAQESGVRSQEKEKI
ncbi:MAG: hypothetical protein AB4080_05075 [Trichodesmium sp.]